MMIIIIFDVNNFIIYTLAQNERCVRISYCKIILMGNLMKTRFKSKHRIISRISQWVRMWFMDSPWVITLDSLKFVENYYILKFFPLSLHFIEYTYNIAVH